MTQRTLPGSVNEKMKMWEEAVRYVQMLLLTDLQPPWLALKFPQALPGMSALSNFTRPTFMHWPSGGLDMVFGHTVEKHLRGMAEKVSLKFSGIVARPHYVCTAMKRGKIRRMRLVAMSPLLERSASKASYRCAQRKQRSGRDVDSDDRRMLQMYILAECGKNVTFLRTKPMMVLTASPPPTFSYSGQKRASCTRPETAANPHKEKSRTLPMYCYSKDDSDRIWLTAESYMGQSKGTP